MHSRTIGWISLGALVLSIVLVGSRLSFLKDAPTYIKIVVGLLPLLFVPPASRIMSDENTRQLPMIRWVLVLGLIFLADLALEFQDAWFPQQASTIALFGMWLIIVFVGTLLILHWRKSGIKNHN